MPRGQKSKLRTRDKRRVPVTNAARLEVRPRISVVLRPLQPGKKGPLLPPVLFMVLISRAPLVLGQVGNLRAFREPHPLLVLLQVFHAQNLMKVPRAKMRKNQAPPRHHPPLIF